MSLYISVEIYLSIDSICLTHVRRLLRSLEKQIIMNLLWLESAINATTMAAWVIREHRKYISFQG